MHAEDLPGYEDIVRVDRRSIEEMAPDPERLRRSLREEDSWSWPWSTLWGEEEGGEPEGENESFGESQGKEGRGKERRAEAPHLHLGRPMGVRYMDDFFGEVCVCAFCVCVCVCVCVYVCVDGAAVGFVIGARGCLCRF